jgi:hypothetical protein
MAMDKLKASLISLKSRFFSRKAGSAGLLSGSGHILYHVTVIVLSAAFALTLPSTVGFAARNFLAYWSFIGNEKIFLVSVEIGAAILLIFTVNYVHRSWKDRRLAKMATSAGLLPVSAAEGLVTRKRTKRLLEKQGFARDVMLMGSTGFRTFVDAKGELNQVLKDSRQAKIMLLHPYGEGAHTRSKSIPDPEMTLDKFREQIGASIRFLKDLKSMQKKVRLKLYDDNPFLKLTILGDYLWLQHYNSGIEEYSRPRYVFEHNQNPGSLYAPLYQYFASRWEAIEIPEYDLDTDELVWRDTAGNETRRERFPENLAEAS